MGLIEDSVFIITTLFAGSLMLLFGLYIIGVIGNVPALASHTADIVEQNFTYLDGIMIIGVVGFSMASLVLAFFIPSHPVFFFTYVFAVIFLIVIAPIYSNAYAMAATLPLMVASAQALPHTALIMSNLPLIAIIVSALIALVTYAKRPGNNALAEFG